MIPRQTVSHDGILGGSTSYRLGLQYLRLSVRTQIEPTLLQTRSCLEITRVYSWRNITDFEPRLRGTREFNIPTITLSGHSKLPPLKFGLRPWPCEVVHASFDRTLNSGVHGRRFETGLSHFGFHSVLIFCLEITTAVITESTAAKQQQQQQQQKETIFSQRLVSRSSV